MALIVSEDHVQQIEQHALATYPDECCGFLIGQPGGDDQMIVGVQAAANTRDDSPRNRFAIEPMELFQVDRHARRDGFGVVGFYHSHPDAPARPSQYDREHAWSGYSYLIISVARSGPQEMASWQLSADGTEFEPEEVRVETDA